MIRMALPVTTVLGNPVRALSRRHKPWSSQPRAPAPRAECRGAAGRSSYQELPRVRTPGSRHPSHLFPGYRENGTQCIGSIRMLVVQRARNPSRSAAWTFTSVITAACRPREVSVDVGPVAVPGAYIDLTSDFKPGKFSLDLCLHPSSEVAVMLVSLSQPSGLLER
jgi:hypothetical protein